MIYEFHPEAEQEFIEAAAYYERNVTGLGERFGNAAQVAAWQQWMRLGPLLVRLRDIKSTSVRSRSSLPRVGANRGNSPR